ncbi:circularly permuted type 2 ATP-grasp protein [Cellulomonas fimi]|uniref:circularly permuted type 2 ATP-grasp protein n=1 Tax=Cellulomonas fimi TaxID=1708 RepID=UPI00234CD185|nr:circularly permuted type 2 ATP-grasp protein [Cellulomonas fimi]MDC7122570.1 circularly permuted type 2 ATP-grasp protein [Cellulomonas fimi]
MTDLLSTPVRPADGSDAGVTLDDFRPDWSRVVDPGDEPTPADLARAHAEAERLLADHGVTYGADAPDGGAHPWRLDPAPVVVDEPEWTALDAGLVQRAELLDAVLQDVYGARRLLTDQLLPPTTVLAHPGFLRQVDGLRMPGGRELVLTATDLVRDGSGRWCAVADRTQAPSGAAYAMEDRRVVAQVMAGTYRQASIQRLGPFFHALRQALRDAAPRESDEPRVALLSSGPASETAFDQAYLASMLGLPLVEGGDLLVREGRVWMRGLDGLERVDVLLRRVDAEWCDPLDLRAGSRLGVPGLVRAVRAGTVSLVNPLGSSVLENPALLAYLPRLARTVLDQDLLLPSAATWWCGEDASRQHVLTNLARLVLLPTARGTDGGAILGWTLGHRERADLADRITAEPWAWVGQEPVGPAGPVVDGTPVGVGSDLPTADGVGPADLGPRAAVLRTFAVAHRSTYTVMAGGLARVAPQAVVSSATGATAKDVWVLASSAEPVAETADEAPAETLVARVPASGISPRTAENLYWMGRYAERAEDRTRVLRVVADRWDDFHARPASVGGRALTVLLTSLTPDALPTEHDGGTPSGPAASASDPAGPVASRPAVAAPPALRALALDPRREGTVARSVRRLGACAAAVRDQLSTDTFGPIARIERALRDERARSRTPRSASSAADLRAVTAGLRPALDGVLEGLLAVAGIAAEGLVRDVGWRLLDAGRRIERAQHLVESLQATLVDQRAVTVDRLVLESVLTTHESVITARRRYQGGARVPQVLDLLVLDRTNPRSLAYQLDRVQEDLAAVPVAGASTDQRDHLLGDVVALVEELDPVAVSVVGTDGRRTRLAETLESMRWRLRSAADEIEKVHFVRPAPGQALEDLWDAPA